MRRKYGSGQADNLWFCTQKSPFFKCFFLAVFSVTAHELMVPAEPSNTHPRPHLMPKEPTDLLNWSRRWTISGVQNVTLYYKIDKVIQLFWWLYKWSLAQGLYKTLDPLFLFLIEHEIWTPEKSAFPFLICLTTLMKFQNTNVFISFWYTEGGRGF